MTTPGRAQVTIVQRTLRRYRQAFFDGLRTQLAHDGIDLRLLYSVYRNPPASHVERGDAATLPWAQAIPSRTWPPGSTKLVWQPALRQLGDADLVIVEQASGLLLNYVLFARQGMGRTRVALWGHGRNFNPSETTGGGETVKRLLSRRAHWWFAYTDLSAQLIEDLGFPPERITVVRNATDTRDLAQRVERVSDGQLGDFLRRNRIMGSNVGLFLGSLVRKRRIGFLIDAAERVRDSVPDFELVVAGGGVLAGEVQAAGESRPWLRYLGPVFGDDLACLLRVAKVLAVPGWVGLVVVDGFAAGVPLVTSRSGAHPPEVSYIEDGRNGRMVDDRGDPAAYAQAIVDLLLDDTGRKALVEGCLAARKLYSVENMVQQFTDGVRSALE
jgi:glycosyltransferase involved in cell wall biosynthesis